LGLNPSLFLHAAPQFHDSYPTSRSSCSISNGPLCGNKNQSPQESPIHPLTEHCLIYFLLKIRMCSIAVIDGEGACMVHCNSHECLCGLSGCQRSERSRISIYFSLLLVQRVELFALRMWVNSSCSNLMFAQGLTH